MHYTVIVPRVGGVIPFINSLGLDGDYIYKLCSSQSMGVIHTFRGQTLMGGKEKWFKAVVRALPLV
jgi:hypothetical protein